MSRLTRRRKRIGAHTVAAGAAWLAVMTASAYGQQPPPATATMLRSVRVTAAAPGGETMVLLEFDGAIVRPRSAALIDPPRVYLDLAGVDAKEVTLPVGAPGKEGLVVGTRFARRSADPPVTRVVFDLATPSAYRLDTAGLTRGKLVVVLNGAGPGGRPSVTAAERSGAPASDHADQKPAPAAAATSKPSGASTPAPLKPPPNVAATPAARVVATPSTAAPRTPGVSTRPALAPATPEDGSATASAAAAATRNRPRFRGPRATAATSRESPLQMEAYAALVATGVERLQALRPVLVAIDRRSEIPGDLAATAAEFEAVGRLLGAITPQPAREATHGLLVRACALGARAARLMQDATRTGDAAGQWNAASAAAGALILLDRAAKDLEQ
jgi:hypothetical protein